MLFVVSLASRSVAEVSPFLHCKLPGFGYDAKLFLAPLIMHVPLPLEFESAVFGTTRWERERERERGPETASQSLARCLYEISVF